MLGAEIGTMIEIGSRTCQGMESSICDLSSEPDLFVR